MIYLNRYLYLEFRSINRNEEGADSDESPENSGDDEENVRQGRDAGPERDRMLND